VPFDFISEGDSPAFLHLVDVGLDNLNHPSYGGWGGRFAISKDNPNRFEDNESAADFNPESGNLDINYAQTRWLVALQEDFAARANWCIKPFQEANHAPTIQVQEGTLLKAKAGQKVRLHILATDPDKQGVDLNIWPYPEAGDGKAPTSLQGNLALVEIPKEAKKGQQFHVIVEGKDRGTPALTRYRRVIIQVI
jgi:hypothetical protein